MWAYFIKTDSLVAVMAKNTIARWKALLPQPKAHLPASPFGDFTFGSTPTSHMVNRQKLIGRLPAAGATAPISEKGFLPYSFSVLSLYSFSNFRIHCSTLSSRYLVYFSKLLSVRVSPQFLAGKFFVSIQPIIFLRGSTLRFDSTFHKLSIAQVLV